MLAEYIETWRLTGPAGRRFLTGGTLFAIRMFMFYAAFPLFAKERGYDAATIGWLVGGAALSLFVFGVPVTAFGSRGHTRRLLMIGPLIAASGQLLLIYFVGRSFSISFLAALVSGMASTVFWILGDPLLAATTPPHKRAHIFALKFSLVTCGFAVGSGLGGWIPATLELVGLRAQRALDATILVIACLDIASSIIYSTIPAIPTPSPAKSSQLRSAPARFRINFGILLFIFLLTVPDIGMAFGHNSIRPFLSLFFEEQLGLSSALIGTTMFCLAMAGGISALFIPGIARRLGNLRAIGLLRTTGALMILLCFSGVGTLVVIALLISYYSMVDGTEATFITEAMERLPVEQRTVFSGMYSMLWSASSFCASALSGRLQEDIGFGVAYSVGVAGYLLSVAWILGVFPRLPSLGGTMEQATAPASAVDEVAVAGKRS
mgnify:FL=1